MKKIANPLTGTERVKGHYIRKEDAAPKEEPTRKIMKEKVWSERNTRGNPIEKKPKKK